MLYVQSEILKKEWLVIAIAFDSFFLLIIINRLNKLFARLPTGVTVFKGEVQLSSGAITKKKKLV